MCFLNFKNFCTIEIFKNLQKCEKQFCAFTETFLDPTPECSCSEFMNENGFGRCIRLSGGKPVCYVNEPSNCTDLGFSKSTGKYYSWEACSYYKGMYYDLSNYSQ